VKKFTIGQPTGIRKNFFDQHFKQYGIATVGL